MTPTYASEFVVLRSPFLQGGENVTGTRIIYRVVDDKKNLVATLFSNSSHTTQFAGEEFERLAAASTGPCSFVESLLSLRYLSYEGNHRQGDRIFWLVPAEEAKSGDREAIWTAEWQDGYSAEGLLGSQAPRTPWKITEKAV